MNRFVPALFLAACASAAFAQTPAPKPATPAKPSSSTAKPASAATPAAAPQPWIKLPPGVPRVVHLPVKMTFALRYEEIKVGAGALGESGKLWHLKYTGWRASDGIKFDAWDDHKQPEIGPDGKPKLGPDGKPLMKEPEPIAIPQGMGRVIPGFDYGLEGMKIGGKRRIFIPWQMAYGTRNIPDSPTHPGIPAKSDLIFDVELVDVTEMPAPPHPMVPPNRPMPQMPPHPGAGAPPPGGSAPGTGAQPNAAPTPKPAPPATPPPATQSAPPTSAQPQPPTAPQSQQK